MGGKGGGGHTTSTVTQTSLPEYAQPYYERLMSRGEAESNQPYVPYGGQRVMGYTPFQGAYYQGLANMGPALPVLEGQTYTRQAVENSLNNAAYNPNSISSLYTPVNYSAQSSNPQMVNSGSVAWNDFNPAVAAQYMSPYMDMVTGVAKNRAIQDFAVQQNQRDTTAQKQGAFGGTRFGVENAAAQNDLLTRLGNIDVEGRQAAFENAQQQFERDRGAGLQGQQFNVQSGLQAALANQGAGLQGFQLDEMARQFGAQFGDESSRYYNDSQMAAGLQNEQMRQAASRLGLDWTQLAGAGAQQLGGLGELFQNLELSRFGAFNQAGGQQRDMSQQALDVAYQDFINQRDYERQNLQFLNSLLHGVPVAAESNVINYANANPWSQALGMGIGGVALSNMMGGGNQGGGG